MAKGRVLHNGFLLCDMRPCARWGYHAPATTSMPPDLLYRPTALRPPGLAARRRCLAPPRDRSYVPGRCAPAARLGSDNRAGDAGSEPESRLVGSLAAEQATQCSPIVLEPLPRQTPTALCERCRPDCQVSESSVPGPLDDGCDE